MVYLIEAKLYEAVSTSATEIMDTSCFSEISDSLMISFESTASKSPKPSTSHARPEVAEQVRKHVSNKIKYKHSISSLEETIKIVNEAPGTKFQLPATIYNIRKKIEPVFEHEFHYECGICGEYTAFSGTRPRESVIDCDNCNNKIEKKSDNFFVYIPLQQQLQESIQNNWTSILTYSDLKSDDNYICDVQDGSIWENLNEKYPNSFNLSLSLNTDGVQVFKSTKKSLWPLQIIQNYLHPRLRYIPTNIILVGLHFGEGKPNPIHFFLPLIKELEKMHQSGGFSIQNLSNEIVFLPFITHCACDSPAKALCQGMLQYIGQSACGYCLHPGIAFKNRTTNPHQCAHMPIQFLCFLDWSKIPQQAFPASNKFRV